VIKKKFINPGAYSIFINQMLKDDIPIMEINDIFDFQGNYAKFILEDGRQPKYKQVVKSDISLRNYFHTHDNYYRHLKKQLAVYEPLEIIDWVEDHEDIDYFTYELGYTTSSFNRSVVETLREELIPFLKLYELTTIIDLWEDSELGDFSLSTQKWYSGLVKREEENGS
jgi:hypothetical protein